MSSYIPVGLRQRIRRYFQECCAYCRTPEQLSIAIYEIEHIITRVNGGVSTFENLCFACPTCNRYKGTRQFAPSSTTGEQVALFHPHQQKWGEHFAWSPDTTRIIGQTEIGDATVHLLRMNRPELIRLRTLWVRLGEFPPLF